MSNIGPTIELEITDFIDSKFFDEITFTKAYELGFGEPRHPVPAIILDVTWHPFEEDSPYHDSIMIQKVQGICPCCGGLAWDLAAIWDFYEDRCRDFFLPFGEYVNARQLEEGITAYQEFIKDNSFIQ